MSLVSNNGNEIDLQEAAMLLRYHTFEVNEQSPSYIPYRKIGLLLAISKDSAAYYCNKWRYQQPPQ